LLESGREFIETRHFKDRMAARRFDMNDVIHLARTGRILNPPEYDMGAALLRRGNSLVLARS
jgi:hypothetical protein